MRKLKELLFFFATASVAGVNDKDLKIREEVKKKWKKT